MDRPSWVDDRLYPFADHWAHAGGARLHYVDEGSGTPVLMVHGNPTWSFLYRHLVEELRSDFRCIAVDLPGMGLSEAPSGFGFHAAEHAEVLRAFIDALDLDGYILFGQDWGGPLGLAAAGRRPQRVTGLILGNTWAWSMAGRPAAHVWSLAIGGIPGRWLVERLNGFAQLGMRLGVANRRPSGRVLDHYLRPFPTPASRRPTWMFAREVTGASDFLRDQVEPALEALRDRPALLPWGERDPVFPASDRDRLAAALPRAVVHPLADAGHFIQEDAPEEIAAAVRSWWAAT